MCYLEINVCSSHEKPSGVIKWVCQSIYTHTNPCGRLKWPFTVTRPGWQPTLLVALYPIWWFAIIGKHMMSFLVLNVITEGMCHWTISINLKLCEKQRQEKKRRKPYENVRCIVGISLCPKITRPKSRKHYHICIYHSISLQTFTGNWAEVQKLAWRQ